MKFCPNCQTRYDEEILRFCTKDGTPLVEENQPVFTELPSQENGEDDFGEETVIRRNPPASKPVIIEETQHLPAQRIVIPTKELVEEPPPQVQTKTTTVYQTPPRKSNTGKIVLLTLLGTFMLLGISGLLYMMTRERSNNVSNANQNINVNANFGSTDANLNTNFNTDNTFANFNTNADISPITNLNTTVNANIKTPTPTPKPSPSPSATRPPIVNTNINASNSNSSPTTTPTPRPSVTPSVPSPSPTTPKPSPSATPPVTNRPVNAGVLNGRAVNLPKPAYPPIAKQMRAAGQVAVQVVIDEAGNVTSAKAMSGNALLRAPAEAAARQSKINPVKIGDRNVQAVGILLYNFVNQ